MVRSEYYKYQQRGLTNMRVLRKIVVSFIMAASIGAVSSTAYAVATGEAKVTEASENTVAKIEEAVSLAEKGGDKAAIVKAINEARQIQKEFRYEVTERQRERANNILKAARDAYSKDDLQTGEAKLREALAAYKAIKATYDAKH
jgi:large subunit ribosomal protein L7/L12